MDENRAAEFTGRVLADSAAAATIVLAALGDRTGLFKDLAEHGPATSGELASRTGLSERYVREWLGGMFAAGYLSYDDAQQRYALPAEHVPTLATEPGPAFFGGVHQELIGAIQRYDQVAEAFRRGGGVRPGDLHPDVWAGTSRFTAQWHQNMLVQQWLPLLPQTSAKLRAGARVADVGCGTGQALIALARAFPSITGTGYDVHPPSVEPGPARRRRGRRLRPDQLRSPRRGGRAAGLLRRDHHVRRGARRGRPARPAPLDPGRAAARRQLPLPGDQLLGPGRRQRWSHRRAAVRVLGPVLHDHLARRGRRGPGHPRDCPSRCCATWPPRPVSRRSATSRWTTRSTASTS